MDSQTKLGLFTLLFFILIVFAASFLNNQPLENKTPLSGLIEKSRTWSASFKEPESESLKNIVQANLKDQQGNYAVVFESLKPDGTIREYYGYNQDRVLPAASLYKLFLLAAAQEQIEAGNLTDDDLISASPDHLEEVLGSKDFGYEDPPETIEYSVGEIMVRIATISDNYASLMLAEKIGWDSVQRLAVKIGAKQTTIKAPISTTAADVALFYQKLFKKEVVSKRASDKIIELISASKLNSRIPKYLSEETKIAHKTGELAHTRNDGGLVFLEGNPYIIVMMADNVPFEDESDELEAKISKDVYVYFKGKELGLEE